MKFKLTHNNNYDLHTTTFRYCSRLTGELVPTLKDAIWVTILDIIHYKKFHLWDHRKGGF